MTDSRAPQDLDAGAILTIDLDAIAANYQTLCARLDGARSAAVVKADAYGLRAEQVAPILHEQGCRDFFVAILDEGIALRRLLSDATIYILSGLMPGTEGLFAAHRLVPVLNDLGQLEQWQKFCNENGPMPAVVHIDTGMNRLGLSPRETDRLIAEPDRLNGIDLKYYMSHLVSAEQTDHPLNQAQLRRLSEALAELPPAPATFSNSSGVFISPDHHLDLVRFGVALYGVNPIPGRPNPMQQVVRLDGRILQVRDVDSSMTVGYGATHKVEEKGKIATIAVGYADGYLRSLSSRGSCFIDGIRVPVVGRVSMDLIGVDVSEIAPHRVKVGGLVELLGPNHTVDDLAREAGTIGYEILTSLGSRYRRRYISSSR